MTYLVTTCMGRLEHLKQSVAAALERTDWSVVVVDWSDPECSGEWAESLGSPRVRAVRGVADFGPRGRLFHCSRAKNEGARKVPRDGDPVLVFSNADCLVEDGASLSAVASSLKPKEAAYVCRSSWRSYCGLGGFLMVRASTFDEAGGFADWMTDWSPDDFEMRIRLHLLGSGTVRVDPAWLRLIEHSNESRVRNYRNQNMIRSMYGSWKAIGRDMERRFGVSLEDFERTPSGLEVLDRTGPDGERTRLEAPPPWLAAARAKAATTSSRPSPTPRNASPPPPPSGACRTAGSGSTGRPTRTGPSTRHRRGTSTR